MIRPLNCRGNLLDLRQPQLMGILNVTPDSFYTGSRQQDSDQLLRQAEQMLKAGAAMLDIGGASSRPGAAVVPEAEELERTIPAITAIVRHFPEVLISIDTWRAGVARAALEAGAVLVNDISAGRLDPALHDTVAAGKAPYILMHMQGDPSTMQQAPQYEDVVLDVLDFFIAAVARLREKGIHDIILDPGFGFGKTVEHNFTLLKNLHVFHTVLDLPVLAGISRKSMICKVLGIAPDAALNGTTALHMVALQQGARILRVHDVREAREAIRLWEMLA
jgi:dihydropteroate synthase